MIDNYGRPVNSIRVSVTKECNLNCFYCHREGIKGQKDILDPEDFEPLFRVASSLGIKKVKFTGGEPLERADLEEIIKISKNYFTDISLTTNGTKLKDRAWSLYNAGLNRINISLHTLKKDTYKKITGKDLLENVLEGIEEVLKTPLNPIKINMVYMKGLNDNEINDLMEFVKNSKMILQIIELEVPVEGLNTPWYLKYHLSLDEVEKYLRSLNPEIKKNPLHNRDKFIINVNGSRYEVELVKPMHNTEFCKNCTRIRFTYDGKFKPCIFRNDNLVDVLGDIKNSNEENIAKKLKQAVNLREPYWKG